MTVLLIPGFLLVGLPLTGGDEVPQAALDVKAPRVRTVVEALEFGNETQVGESDLRLIALRGDIESDVGARPLGLVFGEVQEAVQDVPDDALAREELGDLLFGVVDVLVSIGPHVTEFVGATLDLS